MSQGMGSTFILPLLQLLLEISSQTPSWGAGLPPGWQCAGAAPPPHPPWLSSLQFHSQLLFLYLNPSPWQGIQTCQEGSPVLLFPTTNTSGRFAPAPLPHHKHLGKVCPSSLSPPAPDLWFGWKTAQLSLLGNCDTNYRELHQT